MTIIEEKLIQKSQAIFDQLDKWNAFIELKNLSDQIIENWLAIGTEQLRKHFEENRPQRWRWKPFWFPDRDTRWYIEEFGGDSLAITFADYKLCLHLSDTKRFDHNWIGEQLRGEKVKYAGLLLPFGMNPVFKAGPTEWVVEEKYDFAFGRPSEGNINRWELAWYASHQTDNFVTQAAKKIERFVGDPEITRLVTELNAEAQKRMTN
jgi:hypothetical protein